MPEVKRGEVYWAKLDPSVGAEIQKTRPVVILSVNPLNRARRTVIAVPLSTAAEPIAYINVALTGGSVARCDQVRTLDKSRLAEKIGSISKGDLEAISEGVRQVMGL